MKLTNLMGLTVATLGMTMGSMIFATTASAAVLTDSQIIDVVKTADWAEVDAAKMAKSKANDSRVKDFAKNMIKDHEDNAKEGKKVAKNNNIKMESNDVATNLKDDAKVKMKDLKQYKGSAFDKAYIDQQVAAHQQLLNDLDQTFIPAAQNAELKTYLQDTRTHVQEHLSKAQEIQSAIASTSSSM